MNTTWSKLSIVIGIVAAIFALVDILLGVGHIFHGYGLLSILPLSLLGIVLGITGSRQSENRNMNAGLIVNSILLLSVPAYWIFGTLIFGP